MANGSLPWMTSQDLVAAVERKISFPIAQNTFSSDDILAFASEEMQIALVPQILTYHEEYFVFLDIVPLLPNKLAYSVPTRAIGMRLRSVFYVDTNGNRFEMVRVNPDDKSFFQYTNGSNESAFRYYLQGNQIVLTPNSLPSPVGYIEFGYYLRPNQLVDNSRASIISNFSTTIQCVNSSINPGDQVIITNNVTAISTVLTAVASSPSTNQFLIGATSIITAQNLANALLALPPDPSSNQPIIFSALTSGTATITILYNNIELLYNTSNTAGFIIQPTLGILFQSIAPNITTSSLVDFLQTNPGHRTYAISIPIISISGNTIQFNINLLPNTLIGISGNLNTEFNPTLVTNNIQVGDYICQQYECIIPQVPPDLHTGLAERTCARILAAIGDQIGLQATQNKIAEIQNSQNPLLGARIDGDGKKVFPRKTLLRYGKFINYRRF
jgi:hypothetical protein